MLKQQKAQINQLRKKIILNNLIYPIVGIVLSFFLGFFLLSILIKEEKTGNKAFESWCSFLILYLVISIYRTINSLSNLNKSTSTKKLKEIQDSQEISPIKNKIQNIFPGATITPAKPISLNNIEYNCMQLLFPNNNNSKSIVVITFSTIENINVQNFEDCIRRFCYKNHFQSGFFSFCTIENDVSSLQISKEIY